MNLGVGRDGGANPPRIWSPGLTAGRMLVPMAAVTTTGSPVALAALVLLGERATAAQLKQRFAAAGVKIRAADVGSYIAELESLGLVRIARPGPASEYVATALGVNLIEHGAGPDAWLR